MENVRDLPFSYEAEQAIIGSVLLNPDCILEVLEVVKAEYFYVEKNRHIFEGMVELFNENKPIDIVTLGNLLIQKGVYDAIGGNDYIKEIINNMPLTLNVKSYGEIIKDKAVTRELINSAKDIEKICYENKEVNTMLDVAMDKVFSVAQKREGNTVTPIRGIVYENYNRLSELVKSDNKFTGVSTGYKYLDQKLQGLKAGNLVLIAARPGMGKSSLATNIAQHAAIYDKIPTVIFTLEMSKEELANRIICSEAKINNTNIKSGELSEEEIYKYIDALEPIAASPLYIDDTSSITITEIKARCKRLKLEKNIGLIVIDYLQLMTGTNKESRQQEISEISRSLKLLAKELEVPVIALSQLSRATEQRKDDHRPMLSDLRESGAIEQDADIVMFLYRDDFYHEDSKDKNIAECIIAKNRAGETGKVKLTWLGEFTTFYNCETAFEEGY